MVTFILGKGYKLEFVKGRDVLLFWYLCVMIYIVLLIGEVYLEFWFLDFFEGLIIYCLFG